MAKPTDVPEWATDDDFATGPAPVVGTPTKVDPGALSGQGFVPGTAAAAQLMNWLLNRGGSWFKWLDGLVDDDGTVAQVKRGMLQVLDSVRSDIIAGDADGVYARLRGEANLSHVVASAVEDEVYAALTSWLDTERARLSLRGTLREILGRDMAGDGAPISVPNGLNVGGSFTPPVGYLMGEPIHRVSTSPSTWVFPAGVRAALVEAIGAGGGATVHDEGDGTSWRYGGGSGAYSMHLLPASAGSLTLSISSGGAPSSDGDDTEVSQGGSVVVRAGGGRGASTGSPGSGGSVSGLSSASIVGIRGSSAVFDPNVTGSSGKQNGCVALGGPPVGPYGYGRGGTAYTGTGANLSGGTGAVIITPLY